MLKDIEYFRLYMPGNDPETLTSTLLDPLMLVTAIADQHKIPYSLEKIKILVQKDKDDYDAEDGDINA